MHAADSIVETRLTAVPNLLEGFGTRCAEQRLAGRWIRKKVLETETMYAGCLVVAENSSRSFEDPGLRLKMPLNFARPKTLAPPRKVSSFIFVVISSVMSKKSFKKQCDFPTSPKICSGGSNKQKYSVTQTRLDSNVVPPRLGPTKRLAPELSSALG